MAHTAEALSLVAGMILVCAKQYIPKDIPGIAEERGPCQAGTLYGLTSVKTQGFGCTDASCAIQLASEPQCSPWPILCCTIDMASKVTSISGTLWGNKSKTKAQLVPFHGSDLSYMWSAWSLRAGAHLPAAQATSRSPDTWTENAGLSDQHH